MRKSIVAVLTVAALCAFTANAQVPAPAAVPLDGDQSASQNWVFGTHPIACDYQYVDGIDLVVGWVEGEMAWMNLYNAGELGDCPCITGIETRIGQEIFVGRELKVYIWQDPNTDYNPLDAELIGQGLAVPVSTDLFTIDLNEPVAVTEHFWVAGVIWHADAFNPPFEYPGPYDTSQPSLGRGWMGYNDPLFNAVDLGANAALVVTSTWPGQFPEGVWQVRPILGDPSLCDPGPVCVPCDMNCDADINALDIEFFIDLLFNGTDPCCGNRGDIGSTGDVNLDGSIDALDIEGFINCLFP